MEEKAREMVKRKQVATRQKDIRVEGRIGETDRERTGVGGGGEGALQCRHLLASAEVPVSSHVCTSSVPNIDSPSSSAQT